MDVAYWLLVLSMAAEALLLLGPQWRKTLAITAVAAVGLASLSIAMANFGLVTFLIVLVSLYRLFNIVRVVAARLEPGRLRRSTRRTGRQLMILQLLLIGLQLFSVRYTLSSQLVWTKIALVQLAVALVLAWSLRRQLRKTALYLSKRLTTPALPTLSVLIPARNEDAQLEACLHSVLASDYPKVEVIVLDDCSHDRTPEIIRGFAHDGVRFIPGRAPQQQWLAKNQAYDALSAAASGELLLFCGVDVRFERDSLRSLVSALVAKKKSMLSVLPRGGQRPFPFVQSLRYAWEMLPPRRLFRRPPVLSSCWLIRREALHKLGGFAAVREAITPEAYFARETARHDVYSFVRSTPQLGIRSYKSAARQTATAVRSRYPQLHRRPEAVMVASVFELGFLLGPFVLVLVNPWLWQSLLIELAALGALILNLVLYRRMVRAVFEHTGFGAALAFPYAVVYDVALLHYSMWKYEFSEVIWKGRNVCLPALRVVPRLPKLK